MPLTSPAPPIRLLLFLLLLLWRPHSCRANVRPGCQNRLDIVIVMDVTSSQSDASHAEFRDQVKALVQGFQVGPQHTRLALVSAAGPGSQPSVLADFDRVGSLGDFNAAVDRASRSPGGRGDLSLAMRAARERVLNSARKLKTVTVLVLVMDRRDPLARAASEVARQAVTREADELRAVGTAIHAVGVGGLWFRTDLEAVFGTGYLLFKNRNKALESIKSLNNHICEADCPRKGQSSVKPGLCHKSTRQVFQYKVDLAVNSNGLSVCRREVETYFESCTGTLKCDKIWKDIGKCEQNGKLQVTSHWQSFNYRKMECVMNQVTSVVDCKDALKCVGQMADVIFILDRSTSLYQKFHYVRAATKTLMEKLDVGPRNTRAGLITFDNDAFLKVELGAPKSTTDLLNQLQLIPDHIDAYGKMTYTNKALELAESQFKELGRNEAPHFVFLITDGESTDQSKTFAASASLKNQGVALIAVGVGRIKLSELETLTAPETDSRLVILEDVDKLADWSAKFAEKICFQFMAPDAALCEDNIVKQTISECLNNKQQVTTTKFVFDAKRNCIRTIHTDTFHVCRSKCIDPINGNEQFQGDNWKSRCQQFHCPRNPPMPLLPASSECLAVGGSCHRIGSSGFSCTDDTGAVFQNCRCESRNGRATLVIDTN